MLRLDDHWTWDFWLARDRGRFHVFYLKAPKSLGDPALRHASARVGHAVSDDLRSWEVLPDALGPGRPGAWDDLAIWTGSVLCHRSRWYLLYTGVGRTDGIAVQRIGVACSDDLISWQRPTGAAVLTADPRWYERLDRSVWHEEAWRDPWVFPDPSGHGFRMLLTARVNHGPPDGRGVVGQAWSPDLLSWEAREPLTQPGDFGHMEVPQLASIGGRHYLLFSVYEWAHSARRLQRAAAVCGTHYLVADTPLGPYASVTDEFLSGTATGPFYAGRVVEDRDGRWQYLAWAQFDDAGGFVGALSDPVEVIAEADGRLRLADRLSVG